MGYLVKTTGRYIARRARGFYLGESLVFIALPPLLEMFLPGKNP